MIFSTEQREMKLVVMGAGAILSHWIAAPAFAVCSNNTPAAGETVTCTTGSPNPDTMGVASANTGVTVNVDSGAAISTATFAVQNQTPLFSSWTVNNAGALNGGIAAIGSNAAVTVANTGTIVGGNGIQGVSVNLTSNTGTIAATSGSGISGGLFVTNNAGGSINGTTNGIDGGLGMRLTNAGTVTGGTGAGVTVTGGIITNQSGGTISGSIGINSGTAFITDSVVNAGTLTGTNGIAIINSGNLSLTLQTGSVLNGDIIASGSPGAATTLALTGTGTEDSRFSNFKSILAVDGANWKLSGIVSSFDSTTITTAGTGMLTISGTVSGDTIFKNGTGTLVLTGMNTYSGGTFINGGVLRVGADANLGSASGQLNLGGATLQFGGAFDLSATRPINFSSGGGIFDTNGFNSTITQGITGTGGLTKAGAGVLTLNGNSTYSGATVVDGGTLLVNGSIRNGVTVNSGGAIGGSGTIGGLSVGNGGRVAPGNSIGTINVAGNVTFAPQSIYVVEINPQGQADRVVATGTATIQGGTVQVQAESGFYRKDTRYTILTAAGGVVGTFTTLTTNLAFLDLSLVYDANNVFLNVNRNSVQLASLAHTENQFAVGRALDAFALNPPSADATTVSNALFNLSEPQARAAYDQISGAAHGNMVMSDLTIRRMFGRALDERLMQEHAGVAARASAAQPGTAQYALAGTASQDFSPLVAAAASTGEKRDTSTGWHTWVKGLGQFNSTTGNSNAEGYDLTIGGALLGADYKVLKGLRLGAAIGYAHGNFDGDNNSGSGGIDSYQGLIYGRYDHGKFFFADAQAGYAFNNYDLSRGIAFSTINRTASSDADGHDVSSQLRIGAKLDSGGFNIVPSVSLRYDRLQRDGFTESGADSLNLTVRSKSFTALRSLIGSRVSYALKLDENGIELEPYAGVHWQHDFRDSAVPVEARFSGIGIDVHGTEPGRDAAMLQVGTAAVLDDQFTLFAGYDAEIRTRQTDHAVSVGMRYRW
jgi:fibronectin-binding autotransporter adhesin